MAPYDRSISGNTYRNKSQPLNFSETCCSKTLSYWLDGPCESYEWMKPAAAPIRSLDATKFAASTLKCPRWRLDQPDANNRLHRMTWRGKRGENTTKLESQLSLMPVLPCATWLPDPRVGASRRPGGGLLSIIESQPFCRGNIYREAGSCPGGLQTIE